MWGGTDNTHTQQRSVCQSAGQGEALWAGQMFLRHCECFTLVNREIRNVSGGERDSFDL